MIHAYKCLFSSDCEEKTVSLVPHFLLTRAAVLHFFLCKGTPLSETADTSVWGDHCWIVAGLPAEQKQLIRASQTAAHKTPSARESPLSLCYVTDWERRGEWDCACAQNLNTCCFVPCGKLTSTCVLKTVMADWNCSNHFDAPCIPIVQPTRCTCYLKLFILLKRSTCFGRSFRLSSGPQNCVYINCICQTEPATCCYWGWDGVPFQPR